MLFLVAASLLWAFSFGLIKSQLAGVDPVVAACARLLLAAALFAPAAARVGLARTAVRRAVLVGAIQFGLMYALYIASFAWLAAWQVALFTVFTPLYVVWLDNLAQRRFEPWHALAALVAVAGALLAVGGGTLPAGGAWRGIALLQAANLCFAWGQLQYRRLLAAAGGTGTAFEAGLIGWMYGGAFLVTLLAVLARKAGGLAPSAGWTPGALAALLYLGLLPTGLGFYLWNLGAARTSAGVLAVANNLKVPLAILVAWLVFGETAPFLRVFGGLALMIGGLLLAGRKGARRPVPQ